MEVADGVKVAWRGSSTIISSFSNTLCPKRQRKSVDGEKHGQKFQNVLSNGNRKRLEMSRGNFAVL